MRHHAINLQLNSNSISAGPYRYAYHHKDETEKQAERLLAEGKLRQYSSFFPSSDISQKQG
jgi:hypothetical protein